MLYSFSVGKERDPLFPGSVIKPVIIGVDYRSYVALRRY